MKIAILDIGSNSVRLMLWADGKTLYKKVQTTRLGEGIANTGMLLPAAIERTALAVQELAEEGRSAGAAVYAFATAAVRASRNGSAFVERVKELCGVEVDVVPGQEEALLGLYGALGQEDGGIIDIGGASTEICIREGGKIAFSVSLDIGAVRLYDRCGDQASLLEETIRGALSPLTHTTAGKMYAIGGTGSTLASLLLGLDTYDARMIQDFKMMRTALDQLSDKLLSMTAEERKNLKGMDVRRADIIAGGALLLVNILKKMSLLEVYASDRDNLEGYLQIRGLA